MLGAAARLGLVLLLGVVALEPVASFADLLGDDVVGVALDDPLGSARPFG